MTQSRKAATTKTQAPIFFNFEQMREWIDYVVRSQKLARYVISACATFLSFAVAVSNAAVIHYEASALYWLAFSIIASATALSVFCLLRLMHIEAKLSERLVQDSNDLDVEETDLRQTYLVRRLIAVSLTFFSIGVFLFLTELSGTGG